MKEQDILDAAAMIKERRQLEAQFDSLCMASEASISWTPPEHPPQLPRPAMSIDLKAATQAAHQVVFDRMRVLTTRLRDMGVQVTS
ncbi:MAG: hypothetical protein AAF415_13025 [Pseudomonadota bacterium]